MDITRQQVGDVLEVAVEGRLDSYWAEHLRTVLRDSIQEGSYHISLDLARVDYISSAGIGVLVWLYKQLHGIDGVFKIAKTSEAVTKILTVSGLAGMLLSSTGSAAPTVAKTKSELLERDGVRYEIYENVSGGSLECRLIGDPSKLDGCRFHRDDCHAISVPDSGFALGLGAFGREYEECQGRFGEFMAVAGTAAYLPTDGTGTPDYLVSAESALPEMTLLYGLTCDGAFGRLARFESSRDAANVSLSGLVSGCLEIAGADAAGLVIVAESAGLMGAALRRSPASGETPRAPFSHPEIREWLSFTPERVFHQTVTLIVGVATRSGSSALSPMLRPLGEEGQPAGHFHAAALTYGPMKRGKIDLRETVSKLFENQRLEAVLHLLNDSRRIEGVGESEFSRGACWISPISSIAAEGDAA